MNTRELEQLIDSIPDELVQRAIQRLQKRDVPKRTGRPTKGVDLRERMFNGFLRYRFKVLVVRYDRLKKAPASRLHRLGSKVCNSKYYFTASSASDLAVKSLMHRFPLLRGLRDSADGAERALRDIVYSKATHEAEASSIRDVLAARDEISENAEEPIRLTKEGEFDDTKNEG